MTNGLGVPPVAWVSEMEKKFAPGPILNHALNVTLDGGLDPVQAPDCLPKARVLWPDGYPPTDFIDFTNKFRRHGGQIRSAEANIQSPLAPLNIETKP